MPFVSTSTPEERFYASVEKTESCWVWHGSFDYKGYGRFWLSPKRMHAHRFAYQHFVGPIPDGLTIDHLCRNRACVNPAHLEAVTNRENILRGSGPAALNAQKTHCIRGHEFTDESVVRRGGKVFRICRPCLRAADRRRRWLKRLEREFASQHEQAGA